MSSADWRSDAEQWYQEQLGRVAAARTEKLRQERERARKLEAEQAAQQRAGRVQAARKRREEEEEEYKRVRREEEARAEMEAARRRYARQQREREREAAAQADDDEYDDDAYNLGSALYDWFVSWIVAGVVGSLISKGQRATMSSPC